MQAGGVSGQSQEDDLVMSDLAAAAAADRVLPKKLRDALLLAGSGDHSYDEIGPDARHPDRHGEVARVGSTQGVEAQDGGHGIHDV